MTLDSVDTKAADPKDMMGAILSLPEQCQRAKDIALNTDLELPVNAAFGNAVITGMGGSAIGGDLLRAIYQPLLRAPVEVSRDYHLPGYVDKRSLVIAASYSGNTEETLASYDAARKAGATIVAVTTGGELATRAQRDKVSTILIPGGLQPRAALGYSFVPLIVIAVRAGLMPDTLLDDIDGMIATLEGVRTDCAPDVAQENNRAKGLAARWKDMLPVIYGSQGERGVVAYRWKTQINENAKAIAIANVLPELDHNESVGWSGEHGQARPAAELAVVFLRDDREPTAIKRRAELTKTIVEKHAASVSEVWAQGDSALARTLSLVYTGDFASCYLAYAYGEDPTPVKVIDWLKGELSKAGRP
ncbi:MAG: bifunctional phosphoglucose/phosphomannose isomerase [Candidatus Eremiobacteraeota bacterium]|nr:bifunctional phosphoglucose/phosphomannose isomerase [Candidatus Eremiobacteraeota bacterium]